MKTSVEVCCVYDADRLIYNASIHSEQIKAASRAADPTYKTLSSHFLGVLSNEKKNVLQLFWGLYGVLNGCGGEKTSRLYQQVKIESLCKLWCNFILQFW